MATSNLQALDAALDRTAALVSAPKEILAAIRALVINGTDRELLRINPIRFARAKKLNPEQTVTAMIGASKAGAFNFTWSLTCPMCGGYAEQNQVLNSIRNDFYCSMCDRVSPPVMDSVVEVAFSVDPSVRASPGKFGLELEENAWLELFQNPCAHADPELSGVLERNMYWSGLLRDSTEKAVDVKLSPRKTRVAAVTHNARVSLRCPPGHAGAEVEVHDKTVKLVRYTAEPGVKIRNLSGREAVCVVSKDVLVEEDFKAMPAPLVLEGFLSGRDLLCNQAFRDLYGSETLAAGIALRVESQCVLFTDLKGSTQLYDSIGDVQAFSLVSEHFKILLTTVQECSGAVVKTIGDAVMATFPNIRDGVKAALQMARSLEEFNRSSGVPPLSLKIGLHVGACIVVNSNGKPDYFGQTVNIAARVQALAEGGEFVLTDEAWRGEGVSELLKSLSAVSGEAALKGVGVPVKIHTFALVT